MLSRVCSLSLLSFLVLLLALPVWSQKIDSVVAPQTRPVQNAPAQNAPAQNAPAQSAPAQNTPAQSAPAARQSATTTQDLLIGGGDLLEVTVEGASDYDKQVRVNHDGEIYLPLIGAAKVTGLTITQAQTLIAKRLKEGDFFTDPQVTVFVKEYATQGISVLGEVQKPGIYPLLGSHTLFDVISAAGGTTPKAGNTVMISRREHPSQVDTVQLPRNNQDWSRSNVAVQPGDTVMVSKAGIVYVVGDVHQPGGFVMENSQMTVLQAIAMAQGTNPTASLQKARLIRKTPSGPQETSVPLNRILAAKAADFNLQPEDILFVPSSKAKAGVRRGLDAILQTASMLAVYRP
jgi:polysaccharide export outer membrane protein